MKNKIFGYSLHLNLHNCKGTIEVFRKPKEKDNGALILKLYIDKLLSLIEMTPVYDPIIKYYGDYESNEGYSYIQLINTSNITIHSVSSTKCLYIDLFSCKKFSTEDVIKYTKFFFLPEHISGDILER